MRKNKRQRFKNENRLSTGSFFKSPDELSLSTSFLSKHTFLYITARNVGYLKLFGGL